MIEKAVKRFERQTLRKAQEDKPRAPRVITISRQLGSGGRQIAQTLGLRLNWPVWDREILDVVATTSNLRYQVRMFEMLDEKIQSWVDDMVFSMLGVASKQVYLHLLPRAILIIAQNDAIILGRGAHLLIPEALKIRVVASLETRVENLVRFEGLTTRDARDRIKASDQERKAFIQGLAGHLAHGRREPEGRVEYDLVINTDKIGVHGAASMVLTAARQRFELEEHRAEAAHEVVS